eukprot:TRINITY_DN17445_c0_g1_i2.p1 TRINITY_DN17445_c0_g1~~TRINITY_DN17445_c0_g1_i2.p1  ORF type:complete len:544 (+),score=105.86 TRINITY_DN17445_c0_g1_i2:167-1798(+)
MLGTVAPALFQADPPSLNVLRLCSDEKAMCLDSLARQHDSAAQRLLFTLTSEDRERILRLAQLPPRFDLHHLHVLHRQGLASVQIAPDIALLKLKEWLREDPAFVLMALDIDYSALHADYMIPLILTYAADLILSDLQLALALMSNPLIYPATFAGMYPKLLQHRELLLVAVQRSGAILQLASSEMQCDKEIVITAVRQAGTALEFASAALKADRDVVSAAIQQDAAALQHATDLQGDSSIVRPALQKSGEALRFASPQLRANCQMVALAVANNGAALQYVMEDLQSDVEIVSLAVQQKGSALEFASQVLRSRKTIVSLAVMNDGLALQHACRDIQDDFCIVSRAVQQNGMALQFASLAIRGNREAVHLALRSSSEAFEHVCPELQCDEQVMCLAARQLLAEKGIQVWADREHVASKMMMNPTIVLKDAGKNLRNALLDTILHTREFSLAAVNHDLQLFQDLHDDFKTDEQVALAVVTKRASMLYDLPYQARNFLSVQVAAASQDKGWLSILLPTDKKRAEEAVDALMKKKDSSECISGPRLQ